MDPRYYDDMSGFPNTFSEMSQLYFGPAYSNEVVAMTPMFQPAYTPSHNVVGMGLEMKTHAPTIAAAEYDGKISLKVENQVLSRLQWYNLSIKFVDGAGNPLLANHVAEFDEQNRFHDGRRTYIGIDNNKKEKKVFLQLAAVCHQTGKALRKCSVCIDKDKTVIQKKRKGSNAWSDQDEFNNKRIIQVLPTETVRVDEKGELRVRFRVACCVGVNKHPHHNHLSSQTDCAETSELELHNGCYGLNLTLAAFFQTDNNLTASIHSANSVGPIRVLSKGEKANRPPPSKKRKLEHNSDSTNEDDSDILEDPNSSPASDEYSPRGPLIKKERRISPNVDFLVKVLPNTFDFDSMFHKFAVVQRDYIERYFPSPYSIVYVREFWGGLDLNPQSPQMLEVLTTLTIGACISGYADEARKFSTFAYDCANNLLQSRQTFSRSDSLLVADGLNRFAFCCGARSSIGRARFYNAHSYQFLEQIIQSKTDVGDDATIEKRAFETCMWIYVVCNMNNLPLCQKVCKWATVQGGLELQAFAYFITMLSVMVPDLLSHRDKIKQLVAHRDRLPENALDSVLPSILSVDTKNLVFYYYDLLKATFAAANYSDLVEPGYTKPYKRLIEESFLALDHWLAGNEELASRHALEASVQAAVFDKPGLPALIAIYIAALVNLQLARRDPERHADRVELLMRTFVRNPCWKWLKIMVDFIVSTLEFMVGQSLNITYKHHVGIGVDDSNLFIPGDTAIYCYLKTTMQDQQIPSGSTSKMIKINVGGKKYHTTEATLTKMGDNYITDLLTGKKPASIDEEGYYFIDRNGRYFEPILDYLRTGSLVIPPGMSKELVLREASFYLPNMSSNSHSNSNYFARTSCLRVTESSGEASLLFQIGKETEDLGRIGSSSSEKEQFWSKILQSMDMIRARGWKLVGNIHHEKHSWVYFFERD